MSEIRILMGGVATDDRGSVRFVNGFDFEDVKRFYQVENHKAGFIRAWHGHKKEAKYIYVAKGSALIGVAPEKLFTQVDFPGVGIISNKNLFKNINDEIFKVVLSSNTPKVLYIPPGYYNGFKTLESDTIVQFFSTTTLDESLNDDFRHPYDYLDIWEENYR